jgi:RNA polymerase sigma-70 factor (ECF subfamily)
MAIFPDDEDLMLAVKNGHFERLGLLFDRHHARLFDFFRRMGAAKAEAEDSVQEVFLRILRYRGSFNDGSPFTHWFYRIARNVRIRQHNSAVSQQALTASAAAPDAVALPEEAFERAEDAASVQRALFQLPESARELLVLIWYQELTYDEIAALLEIDPGTARVRAHRAIKALREIYLKETGGRTYAM